MFCNGKGFRRNELALLSSAFEKRCNSRSAARLRQLEEGSPPRLVMIGSKKQGFAGCCRVNMDTHNICVYFF